MYIEYCDMRKVCWEAFVPEKKKLTLLKTNEHGSPKNGGGWKMIFVFEVVIFTLKRR